MASVNFLFRSTKQKAFLNLRLLFRCNDKDYVFGGKTRVEVLKTYWSKQHKKKSKDIIIKNLQTEINNELSNIENYILSAFNSVTPETINKDWLKAQLNNYYEPLTSAKGITIPKDLINYIDYYIEYRKNELKETSIKKFKVIKNKLKRFEAYRNEQILIKNVNDSFKNEFVNYLKTENYAQNTIQREFAIIKTFCKHARFLGIETHPQLDGLRLDKAKVEKIYLSFEDLNKIENIEPSKLSESLENAKDWLIVSCYCGQRISDFMKFTKDQIRVENHKPLIEFTQKKTGKNMTVPLHPKIQEILSKRNGDFPYEISDQRYNDYIKEVCKIAQIDDKIEGSKLMQNEIGGYRKTSGNFNKWELVTSHIGRRSFATNFYGKIPTTYLISVTGHSTEAMFLNYIGKSNKDLALEITNYF
jgi:integrase